MTIIDAHAHYEPRLLDLEAMIAKMDAAGIDKIALIPAMNDPLPKTPEILLTVLRTLMTSPLHELAGKLNDSFYTPEGNLELRGKVYEIYPRPDNQSVAAALAEHPDRFLGWIFLNPALPADQLEELEKWRQHRGFIGVKLHPHWHGWHIERALPIARRCEELDLPVLIHLGWGEKGRFGLLTDRCPRLRLIFAHAGMPHFSRMWDVVRDNPNLRVDLSSPYLSERLVRRAVAAVGPHRALFGTDAPYGFHAPDGSYDYQHIRAWVERLPCPARDVDRVLGGNVEELLAERR